MFKQKVSEIKSQTLLLFIVMVNIPSLSGKAKHVDLGLNYFHKNVLKMTTVNAHTCNLRNPSHVGLMYDTTISHKPLHNEAFLLQREVRSQADGFQLHPQEDENLRGLMEALLQFMTPPAPTPTSPSGYGGTCVEHTWSQKVKPG